MAKVQEVIGRLDGYKPDDVIAVAIWCVEDVLDRARELGIKLSKEQAEVVLERVDRKQDASIGISWDVIDVHLTMGEKDEIPKKGRG